MPFSVLCYYHPKEGNPQRAALFLRGATEACREMVSAVHKAGGGLSQREKAQELYEQGHSPADIEKITGGEIPANKVRSWKSRYKWPEQKGNKKRVAQHRPQRNAATPATVPALVRAAEENSTLTEAEKDFCLHYSYRPNASRAYRLSHPNCTPYTAKTEGCSWLTKPYIRDEINRLNRIKREKMLETVAGDEAQVFQMMWDIAFSDISEFIEWGQYEQQIMTMYGPMFEKDEETGEKKPVTKFVNDVRFVDSALVDGTLISEVKKGKDGVGIKLPDRMKALEWLANYFGVGSEGSAGDLTVKIVRAASHRDDEDE